MIDRYGRVVNYLRVSLTQRCNFRCQYCMPTTPTTWKGVEELLSLDALESLLKIAIDQGITKIRFSGGEPLLREGIDRLIAQIYAYAPHVRLSLSTNGSLLAPQAHLLQRAGLRDVNISLDTLTPHTSAILTQRESLDDVLAGIDAALRAGLHVKLNTVVMRGINDQELPALLAFAHQRGVTIRFIEYMINDHAHTTLLPVHADEILERLGVDYTYEGYEAGGSPANYYRLSDGYRFGIIAPYKEDFCQHCNRIRLSATGELIPCLYYDESQSLSDLIHTPDLLKERLASIVWNKPEKNRWSDDVRSSRAFYMTGG